MLNLSYNSFNNSILSSLSRLSSLRSLKLSHNKLEGSIDVKGLRKLKSLGLSGTKLNRSILSSLSWLRELDISYTGFKGTFDIRVLSLGMFAEFDSFNNLEVLDMSGNEIDNLVVPQ
ncbi:hypothetical protein CICLE_v10003682mg, partial [Citrus x clementina]